MDIKSILSEEHQLQNVITFPRGLPGFEDQIHFRLFREEGNEIVYWLQAADNEALTFSVAPPLYFNINYNFTLTDEEESLLQVKSPDDLLILILLSKDEESGSKPTITGSFKSPVLINTEKRIGYQKVLADIEQNITLIEKTI
jgi:flagellar assembly factor FliW